MEDNNRGNQYLDLDSLQKSGQSQPQYGKEGKGLFISGLMVGFALSLLIASVAYLGFRVQDLVEKRDWEKNGVAEAPDVEFDEDSAITPELVQKLQVLEEAIDRYFYFDKASNEEIADGIYQGMINALGDRYSRYHTESSLTEMQEEDEGAYYGIGVRVQLDEEVGLLRIIRVTEGSPADEAGLLADDLLYAADGTELMGLGTDEAVALIRGIEGTKVTLTIIREGEADFLEIPVERAKIEDEMVKFEMLEDGIAYIQIYEFTEATIDQFSNALTAAKNANMKGLILDLRANPGGTLNSVLDVARNILPKGLIAYLEDKQGHRTEYTCDGKNELEVPLVVLVDGNSASASEFLAGAIRDHKKGTLVGTTTFGKGIAQSTMMLNDGTGLTLTTEGYFLPNGESVHGVGIEPDVYVEFDGEAYYASNGEKDNQLDKAIEVMQGMIQ